MPKIEPRSTKIKKDTGLTRIPSPLGERVRVRG
jgi:hypothetical protein